MGTGWGPGGYREGLYRVTHQTVPGPIFSHILGSEPYPRPNEGNFSIFNEVSEIGLRMGPESTQNRPRIDPDIDLQDRSPDGPQMTLQMPI